MTGLFGRGGKSDGPSTSPTPLDITGDKSEVRNRINQSRNSGSSYGGYYPGGLGSGYSGSSSRDNRKVDIPNEYSDMKTTDSIEDEEIRRMRIDGYRLANEEKYHDIRNKNDFNTIVKYGVIIFMALIGLGFLAFFGVFTFVTLTSGQIAEQGILGSMLQAVIEMIRIIIQ